MTLSDLQAPSVAQPRVDPIPPQQIYRRLRHPAGPGSGPSPRTQPPYDFQRRLHLGPPEPSADQEADEKNPLSRPPLLGPRLPSSARLRTAGSRGCPLGCAVQAQRADAIRI